MAEPRSERLFLLATALACALGATVVAWPALGGTPVYDDVMLVRSPLMDDPSDVAGAFRHVLLDYQRVANRAAIDPLGTVYRPFAMATLVATQVASGSMRSHHVVSLALHALTAWLCALAVRRSGRPRWLAALAAGLVLLHPVSIEAFVWVFGRFDLVAGLCLAAVAWAFPGDLRGGEKNRYALGALALVAGALSKEAFVVLGPAVALRGVIEKQAPRSARLGTAAALVVAFGLAAAARAMALRGVPASLDANDLLAWLPRFPRLLGESGATLVLPYGRAMRTLAYELSTPIGWTLAVGASAFGLLAATAATSRKRGFGLVVFAAVASLLPAAHVADVFWLGFDRYLYLPLIGIAIAATEAWEDAPLHANRALVVFGAGVLVALGAFAHVGARQYASHRQMIALILEQRPEDPTGSFLEVGRLAADGRMDEAKARLDASPDSNVVTLERQRVLLRLLSRDLAGAVETLDRLEIAHPDDPFVAADAFVFALGRDRFTELGWLADAARQRRGSSRMVCADIERHRGEPRLASAEARQALASAERKLRCRSFR